MDENGPDDWAAWADEMDRRLQQLGVELIRWWGNIERMVDRALRLDYAEMGFPYGKGQGALRRYRRELAAVISLETEVEHTRRFHPLLRDMPLPDEEEPSPGFSLN